MENRIVAVDVDFVVVDLSREWWQYMEECSELSIPYDTVKLAYNYSHAYPDVPEKVASEFWKGRYLYHGKSPFKGSVEALERFHMRGFKVVFVSHVEGDHAKSKVEFLKRNFPFMSGFMATRQKGLLRPEVAFDDRVYHLDSYLEMRPDCYTVRVGAPDIEQPFTADHFYMDACQWEDMNLIDFIIEDALKPYQHRARTDSSMRNAV